MSNKKLQTIKFPGLSDTYTIPQTAADVGALPSTTHIPDDQVNANWTATTGVSSILNKPTIPSAASITPKMDGTGAAGSSATFARADHVHPTDTSRASSSHAHGSVTSDGKITDTGITLANGDALVVTDSSASHVIKKTSITFDGSTTTQALTKKGTWGTFVTAETNPDWNATTGVASILNKPTIPAAQVNSDWNASSGISSILNKPSIPAAQVNANWTATTGVASILNKPTIVNTVDSKSGAVTLKTTTVGSATAGTAISADDITTWTTNTPTQVTKKTVVTSVTPATVVTGGTTTNIPNVTGTGTLPSLTYTAKTVGSASGWSQGSITDASYSSGILSITTGTLPTLTITSVDCDDITAWSSGAKITLGNAIAAYTALTTGAAATVSTGDSVTVTAGVAASLSYTSRSIPNISVATTTVVTGVN